MVDATTAAAIVTGILALLGAVATAWTSGWNEERKQARANKKALARYSVPLIIASWDLANWFHDILDEANYSPERCAAYGNGWDSQFTSYLLGQYFAGVHIIREMTHFFAHIRGDEAEKLKKLLWKIQDEFISMYYDGRENLEMRWFEGDILAAQEHLTEATSHGGDSKTHELRTIGWVEFQKKYAPASEIGNANSPELYKLFEWYEDEFQRIIYRRFKSVYNRKFNEEANPQTAETLKESLDDRKKKLLEKDEERIKDEQEKYPHIHVIVPDHRVRRLQHLLSDLVEVLDVFTAMKLNRPVRRCVMPVGYRVSPSNNPLGLVTGDWIPCDCSSLVCNPSQQDFAHRNLPPMKKKKTDLSSRGLPSLSRRTQTVRQQSALQSIDIVEQSKV